jgi:hypothetical protein
MNADIASTFGTQSDTRTEAGASLRLVGDTRECAFRLPQTDNRQDAI